MPNTNHVPRNGVTASPLNAVCETRADLLNRLASAIARLGQAKLSLESEADDALDWRRCLDDLRQECSLIRRELAFHRLGHGC